MKKLVDYLLWLLFPKRCAICNKLLKRTEHLCAECEEKIERIDKVCNICGNDKRCCVCKWQVFHFRGATAVFNRGEFSKEVINFYKFRGNSEIANFLSPIMANAVKESFSDVNFDYITCVPMHPIKKFIKGFNHSELLARKISKELNIPFLNVLSKTNYKISQHTSSFEERRENVKNLYVSKEILCENILLVDDIKTTGATLDECSRQLMFAGAENVYCVTALGNKLAVEKN